MIRRDFRLRSNAYPLAALCDILDTQREGLDIVTKQLPGSSFPFLFIVRIFPIVSVVPDEELFAVELADALGQQVLTDLPMNEWAEGFWLLAEPDGSLWVVPEVGVTMPGYHPGKSSDDIDERRETWRPFLR